MRPKISLGLKEALVCWRPPPSDHARLDVIDDAILEYEHAHARPLTGVGDTPVPVSEAIVGYWPAVQRGAVARSSEYPAFRRDHWDVGRPLVRSVSILSPCGQPVGESSHVSCRP
jgi:hypothetical protein